MAKTLWLSANLSRLAKGTEGFEVDGETVGECIDDLVNIVPALRETIFLGHGSTRMFRWRLTRRPLTEKNA